MSCLQTTSPSGTAYKDNTYARTYVYIDKFNKHRIFKTKKRKVTHSSGFNTLVKLNSVLFLTAQLSNCRWVCENNESVKELLFANVN